MPKGWTITSLYKNEDGTYHISAPHYLGYRDRGGEAYDKIREGDIPVIALLSLLHPYLKEEIILKRYEIKHRELKQTGLIYAADATKACQTLGWKIGDCFVKELPEA